METEFQNKCKNRKITDNTHHQVKQNNNHNLILGKLSCERNVRLIFKFQKTTYRNLFYDNFLFFLESSGDNIFTAN